MVAPTQFNPQAVELGSIYRSWRIECPIGSGGMGVVYRAQHQFTPRKGAIKVILPPPGVRAEEAALARFQVEAELHVTLRHPNLPDFYDADLLPDGTAILVLEWLDGYDLAKTLQRLPRLTLGDALFVVADVLRPLTVLHPMGIHRDIKPSNIFVCRRPRFDSEGRLEKGRVRLLDFGIAKLNNKSGPTREDKIIGTFNYMSPEQISGGDIDARSDLYAVGALLYEMLAGHPVFAAPLNGDPRALYLKHLYHDPPDLRLELPGLPDDVWAFIQRLLGKKPGDRFDTTVDTLAVARDLRQRYCDSSKIFREETVDVIALIDSLKEERWGLPALPVSAAVEAAAKAVDPVAPTDGAISAAPPTEPDPSRPISGVQAKLGSTAPREAIAVGALDTDRDRNSDAAGGGFVSPTQPSTALRHQEAATLEQAADWLVAPTGEIVAKGARVARTEQAPGGVPPTEPAKPLAKLVTDPSSVNASVAAEARASSTTPTAPAVRRGTFRISQGTQEGANVEDWEQRIVDGIRQLIHAPRCFVRPALVRMGSNGEPVEVIELQAHSTSMGSSRTANVIAGGPGLEDAPFSIERLVDARLTLISRDTRHPESVAQIDGRPVPEIAPLMHGARLQIGTTVFSVTDLAVWDPRRAAKVRRRQARARLRYGRISPHQVFSEVEIVGPLTLVGASPACDLVIDGLPDVRFAVWLRGDGELEIVTLDTSVMPYGEPIEAVELAKHRDGYRIGDDHFLVLIDEPEAADPDPSMAQRAFRQATTAQAVAPVAQQQEPREAVALRRPTMMRPSLETESRPAPQFGPRPLARAPSTPGESSTRIVPMVIAPPRVEGAASAAAWPEVGQFLLVRVAQAPSGFRQAIGDAVSINNETMLVGADPMCDLAIEHPLVSPRHTTLVLNEGFFGFRDIASANGTWLNGKRMAFGELRLGDRIGFGGAVTFELRSFANPGAAFRQLPRPLAQPQANPQPPAPQAPVEAARVGFFGRLLSSLGIRKKTP